MGETENSSDQNSHQLHSCFALKKRQLNGELSVEWNLRCTVVYLLHLVLWLAFCIALGITVTAYNRSFQSHAFTLIHVQTKRRKSKGKLDGSFLSYYNRNQTKKVLLASTWFDNWRRNDNWDKTDINQFWTKREIQSYFMYSKELEESNTKNRTEMVTAACKTGSKSHSHHAQTKKQTKRIDQ